MNQKGGVGKTTTTAALGVLLARQGRGVHLVDMDHQADLTSAFGQNDAEGLLYEALTKRGPLPVVPVGDHLTLTPSSIDLAGGETQFVAAVGREYLLKTCLAKSTLPDETHGADRLPAVARRADQQLPGGCRCVDRGGQARRV